MGNLHEGHMTLVEEAKARGDVVVVSIFVNPMQFERPDDLERYPRTLQEDCEKLNKRGVDLVFAASPADIYPKGLATQTQVDVPVLSTILEGPAVRAISVVFLPSSANCSTWYSPTWPVSARKTSSNWR